MLASPDSQIIHGGLLWLVCFILACCGWDFFAAGMLAGFIMLMMGVWRDSTAEVKP